MMDKQYLSLLYKRLRGEITETEQAHLQSWLEQDPEHTVLAQEVEKIWTLSQDYLSGYTPDVEAGLQRFKERIGREALVHPIRRPVYRRRLAVAAGVLVLITALGLWLFLPQPATFQFARTGAGQQNSLLLSDGTTIILNENSELKYPASFAGHREVHLSGEAYFDVAQNEALPFSVTTLQTRTEVLGTAFNVRAYPEEPFTEVEVISGQVSMQPLGVKETLQLQPGTRGQYHHNLARLERDRPKALNATYWKDRRLRFRAHRLPEALEELQRRLGISVSYTETSLADCQLTTSLQVSHPDTVVAVIADNVGASWEKTAAGTYVLRGGRCR